jgi:hypothetical protein
MPTARPAWLRTAVPVVFALMSQFAVVAGDSGTAWAQQKSSVTSLIQRGLDLFDDQQYEESIQTLSAALLRPGTSSKEKIEIYRLLAYNYITLKRTEEADAAVRGLLALDESFKLPPTESPRFRDVFDATRKKWEEEGKPGKGEESSAGTVPVKILHSSPAQVSSGTIVKLSGTVEDPDGLVRGVQLAYRAGDKGRFVTVSATYSLGQFRTQIPASSIKPPVVEYYLQAIDKGGLPLTSRGDAATPLRIAVPESGGVLKSPWFWVPVGVAVVGGAVLTAVLVTMNTGKTSTVTINIRE